MGLQKQLTFMENKQAEQIIDLLLKQFDDLCHIAKTASKNKKSLSGSNFYGNKFHELLIEVSRSEADVQRLIQSGGLDDCVSEEFSPFVQILKSPNCSSSKRQAALKQVRMFCKSELLPRVEGLKANPVPTTEQVLPLAVVQGTRGYIRPLS